MEFLSLQEPVEVPTVRVSRSEAILVSIGLHLVLVLLFVFGPGVASRVLPESVIAWLGGRPRIVRADPVAPEPAVPVAPGAKPSAPKIPLRFAYVNVPNDKASEKNPNARLLSDKNRRARQDVPTPPDARKFSSDPHSKGTSIDRVKPDPSRPEGREDAEPQHRAPRGTPSPGADGTAGTGTMARNREAQAEATPRADGLLRPQEPPGNSPGERTTQEGQGSPGERGLPEGTGERGGDPRESLKQALSDLKAGEYKFQFNNPAYLRGGGYGTMSFDTQDFPWGDYARRIYLVIRNNWYARIPLAAREGIRGWDCQRFVIEKDGTISSVRTVRPSGVAPFDKSSADALAASSRLPPLPDDFPESSEGVTFCFYYNMYPGEESD